MHWQPGTVMAAMVQQGGLKGKQVVYAVMRLHPSGYTQRSSSAALKVDTRQILSWASSLLSVLSIPYQPL